MNSLFDNAVSSIKIGIEDFQRNDSHRNVSAIRNLYAGLLLLAKEVISRKVPKADLDSVISARYKPIPDGEGGVHYTPDGKNTVDFLSLSKRFKDFGITVNEASFDKSLKKLNLIRNDIEHLYTSESDSVVREAIAKAFPVAVELFRLANEDPVECLGDSWKIIIEENDLYQKEAERCCNTFLLVSWISPAISGTYFNCPKCYSELIEQINPKNVDQDLIQTRCLSCGYEGDCIEIIQFALQDIVGTDLLRRDYETPIQPCPSCNNDGVFFADEGLCANCGAEDGEARCGICDDPLGTDWLEQGGGEGTCFSCERLQYVSSKDD